MSEYSKILLKKLVQLALITLIAFYSFYLFFDVLLPEKEKEGHYDSSRYQNLQKDLVKEIDIGSNIRKRHLLQIEYEQLRSQFKDGCLAEQALQKPQKPFCNGLYEIVKEENEQFVKQMINDSPSNGSKRMQKMIDDAQLLYEETVLELQKQQEILESLREGEE